MQISYISNTNLERTFRLDPEFYQPKYLKNEKLLSALKNIKLITDVSKVSDGNHMAIAEDFDLEGIPYYRGQDITDFFLENNQPNYIPKDIYNKPIMRRSYFAPGDVLVSIVGTIGNLSVVPSEMKEATGSCKIAILHPKNIDANYLAMFLMSKYGNEQIKRHVRGAVQTGLILEDFSQIYVMKASDSFQAFIKKYVDKSSEYNRESRSSYRNAEQIILSEFGLLDWQPQHTLSFIKNFSDTKSADRIDAEFFQPKYDEIVEKVKHYKNGYNIIKNCMKIKDKNFLPQANVTYKYIELANISANGHINGFMESQGKELPTRARLKINTGDLIVSSIEGALSSIALINAELNNALCSTGFFVVKSDEINSETLLVLLKSPIGQLQLKKGCSGTILTSISKDEFKRIVLPKIDLSVQKSIKIKIDEMYKAKKRSLRLLEIAKHGVEMAIEQDETTAQGWMEREIKALDSVS